MSKFSKPAISVVMSVYNEPVVWIQQAIDSILNQTFQDFEFIIINDNPDGDEQLSILHNNALQDPRIKIIENVENYGLTKSLNIGITNAQGKYIARMDADDISMPNRLQAQFDHMETHPDVDICGTWSKLFGNVPMIAYTANKLPIQPEHIKLFAFFYNPMVHPSIVIRSNSFTMPIYNESFNKAQDYVLIGEALINGKKLTNIPQILLKYRVTKKSGDKSYVNLQSYSANYIRKELLIHEIEGIKEEDLKLHNDITTMQPLNLESAHRWLISLKETLIKSYHPSTEFINWLFGFVWSNICLANQKSYSYYKKSSLYDKFSLLYFFRFVKRMIQNIKASV